MTILTFDFYIHCFVDLCGYVDMAMWDGWNAMRAMQEFY